MKVTVINHSSLLINISDKVILTDFWNLSPAFGSWLPSALPFYNPIYLAGLSYNENFYLALSHAHDDHLDDEFFKNYFNKNVKIIINEFPGPSLKNRLKKIGFNIKEGTHPIIPVMLGDALLAKKLAEGLLHENIYVVSFSFPVVPKEEARIRLQISAAHTKKQLDDALQAFKKIGQELKII